VTPFTRPAVFSCEAIHRAWLDCRRRKRGTPGAVAFETRLADELAALHDELNDGTYRPGPCVRFATRRPKLREIVAADFRDRVVHHLFVRAVEPDWERVFIHDSFACRTGKGTHAAVDRLESFVRSATQGGVRPAYYLQVDVRSFFMSIDRALLFRRLDRRLRLRCGLDPGPDVFPVSGAESGRQQTLAFPRPAGGADPNSRSAEYDDLRWLARILVFHDPLEGCEVRGDLDVLHRVPGHKTLAGCRRGCGLPIGNLTSQFFANVYLDALDQHVKHRLRERRYVRYVDDLVLVDEDRERLSTALQAVADFLHAALRLELNPARTRLRPCSSGIDFLGYVIHPDHRLVRRRVVGNLRGRLRAAGRQLVRRVPAGAIQLRFPQAACDRLLAVVNSYLAHLARADARRLVASLWTRYDWLREYLRPHGGKVVRRDAPRHRALSLVGQHSWYARRAAPGVLFLRVGSHFELLDGQARRYAGLLGLREIPARPGFRRRAGFHRRYLARFVERVVRLGLPLTVVEQLPPIGPGTRRRRIAIRVLPPHAPCGRKEEGQ
jgi:hypothetical protein